MRNTTSIQRLLAAAGIAAASMAGNTSAQTAFTYQGSLQESGSPVTGLENIRFRIYDAATGGTLFGETTQNVDVANGVFSAPLNFGPLNTIDPASTWLEIAVDTDGMGAFETLGRQQITAAPFSVNTRGMEVEPSGQVSFTTNTPSDGAMHIENSSSTGFAGTYFVGPGGGLDGFVGVTSGGNLTWIGGDGMQIGSATGQDVIVTTGAAERMRVNSAGNVGIGEPTPGAKLDVAGGALFSSNVGIGTSNATSLLTLESPAATVGSMEFLTVSGGDIRYDGGSDGDVFFEHSGDNSGVTSFGRTGGQRLMTIQNNGRVGVGTSAPPAVFSVVGLNEVIDFTQQGVHIGQIPFADGSGASVNLVGGTEGAQLRFYDTAQTGSCRLWYFPATGEIRMDGGILNGFRVGTDLLVTGNAFKPGGGAWSNLSDRNLKKNISELDGALDTLLALRGVTYEYKDAEAINELSGTRTGFIAQDVEEVMPDWVDENEDGIKRLTIRGFEAIAVEAIREQQEQIVAMQAEIESLKDGKPVTSASMVWPVLIGGGLFGGIAVAQRRKSKA
jgi:hypothetical protein